VIIDTPPAITDMIEQVIALSDLIAIPTWPSPHDLRAHRDGVAACRKIRRGNFAPVVLPRRPPGAAQRPDNNIRRVRPPVPRTAQRRDALERRHMNNEFIAQKGAAAPAATQTDAANDRGQTQPPRA